MKLLYVEWEDSCSLGANHVWKPKDDLHNEPIKCRSVGWLMMESASSLTLASSLTETRVSGDITILKSTIQKRRTLKERP